ncbi:ATP synthase f chain, mitochondrial precursor [Fusarium oxysporum]|nr:ATP synthase f chain, mitochondrial precursor [Fusarium oxysporum]
MSFVTRRALSTLIPPKVASPKAIGAAPDAIRMQRVVSFYEKLPEVPPPRSRLRVSSADTRPSTSARTPLASLSFT